MTLDEAFYVSLIAPIVGLIDMLVAAYLARALRALYRLKVLLRSRTSWLL